MLLLIQGLHLRTTDLDDFEETSIPMILCFCDLKYGSIFMTGKLNIQYIPGGYNEICCLITPCL